MISRFTRKGGEVAPPAEADASEDCSRFTRLFEDSGKGWFWEVDAAGCVTYFSGFEGRSGQSASVVGRRLADLATDCWDEAGEGIGSERTLGFYLSRALPFTDLTVRSAEDPDLLWALTGRPVLCEAGEVIGFRGFGSDLSEKTRAEAELRRAARYDSLTGLPNRATILKCLEDALRVASRTECALLIVDLDRFKEVNDTLGHLVGDDVLRQAATRIEQIFGKHGTVGRLGGDEFEVVISVNTRRETVEELARRCIVYLSQSFKTGERSISIGASVGIAYAFPQSEDAESLFRKADLALYAAKTERGTTRIFEPEMEMISANRQALEHDLRLAMAAGDLEVFFQPVVAGTSENLAGFEALVRWDHSEQGFISPQSFIQIAEDTGLINQLGEWVLRTACQEAAKWPENLFIAVNVSPTQFATKGFSSLVLQALANAGLPAGRLELEITEAVFLADDPAIDETFASLKRIGVRLALDDFGTGYSSLAYLERAPFDKIKIDRAFVKGASLPGSRNLQILEAIVGLAHKLQMQTTAEGAETHQELDLIRRLGCSYIQGFIFGRAIPPEEALAFAGKSCPVDAEGFAVSRAPRHRLIKRAALHVGGQSLPVSIRNLSAGGALLEAPRDLEPGSSAKLEMTGFNLLEVEIRWCRDRKLGVRFISEFDLRGVIGASGARTAAA
ncbi:MAG TPA: EAL domain-containing protein [Allosphingosinicella sp.]|nr:EAL domain-containing protein [Allosphingosinicella sp.]